MDMAVPGLQQGAPYAGMPTWYAASANPAPQRPVLQGAQRATVCVIGAGFTGLSVALELAEKGIDVIVLESERVGWGASGRNGGQLINGYSRGLDVLEARHGPAVARALGAVALEGAAIIRDRVARYGIACDLVDGGLGDLGSRGIVEKDGGAARFATGKARKAGTDHVNIVGHRSFLCMISSSERRQGGQRQRPGPSCRRSDRRDR